MSTLLTQDEIGLTVSEIRKEKGETLAQWNWATWRAIAEAQNVKTLGSVRELLERFTVALAECKGYAVADWRGDYLSGFCDALKRAQGWVEYELKALAKEG